MNKLLLHANDGFFMNQQLLFYALLPNIDSNGQICQVPKSLLIVTNEFLIFMRICSYFEFQQARSLQQSLILSEKLTKIQHYSVKKSPSHVLTGRAGELRYVAPLYFMTLNFKKTGKRTTFRRPS